MASKGSCMCEPAETPRNLVVCIDGTSNRFGDKNTNVIQIYSHFAKHEKQLTYYNSGVGTYARPTFFSLGHVQRIASSILDLAFALSIEKQVQRAYRWISDNYETGDKIYLFGFSRGAYQIRALAGMIHKVGLIYPGNQEQIPFAWEIYVDHKDEFKRITKESLFRKMESEILGKKSEYFKKAFSRSVPVHFVGVWDTVSSVGIIRKNTLPYTDSVENICHFRHALALDERRVKFLPEYVVNEDCSCNNGKCTDDHVKEVWFAGCHGDIGGGNRDNPRLDLESIPLHWMEIQAARAGLQFKDDPDRALVSLADTEFRDQLPTESLQGFWWIPERVPLKQLSHKKERPKITRALHNGNGRIVPENHKIHISVAFKSDNYHPKATFRVLPPSFRTSHALWDSLVGNASKALVRNVNLSNATGRTTRLETDGDEEWALVEDERGPGATDWDGRLDMDFFDEKIARVITKHLEMSADEERTESLVFLLSLAVVSEQGCKMVVDVGAVQLLISLLEKNDTNATIRSYSASALRNIGSYPFGRKAIITTPHAIPCLLGLLDENIEGLDNIEVLDNAFGALANLAMEEKACEELVNAGVVKKIFRRLNNDALLWNAALLLLALVAYKVGCEAILAEPGAIPRLVKLLEKRKNKAGLRTVIGALSNLAKDDEACARLTEGDTVERVIMWLDEDVVRENAIMLLQKIVISDLGRQKVMSIFMKKLEKSSSRGLQNIITALGYLTKEEKVCIEIANAKPLAKKLFKWMDDDDVRHSVSWLLCGISDHDSGREAILEIPEAIPRFLKQLEKKDQTVARNVLRTMGNLAKTDKGCSSIVKTDALKKFIKCLDEEGLQESGTWTLLQISKHESGREAIVSMPGAVSRQLKVLDKRNNKGIKNVLGALGYLIINDDVLGEIAQQSIIKLLVDWLDDDYIQRDASWLLYSIANHKSGRTAIVNEPKAIQSMTNSLEKRGHKGRNNILGAFANLAKDGNACAEIIKGDMIEKFVRYFDEDELRWNATLLIQKVTTYAFGREALFNVPEVVPRLVNLFMKHNNPGLLRNVSGALKYLTTDERACGEIAKPDVINKLVKGLDNETLRLNSTRLLCNIAKHKSCRHAILAAQSAITSLVGLLDSPEMFQSIIPALSHLAEDRRICEILANKATLEKLVKALDDSDMLVPATLLFQRLTSYRFAIDAIAATATATSLLLKILERDPKDSRVLSNTISTLRNLARDDNVRLEIAGADIKEKLFEWAKNEDLRKNCNWLIFVLGYGSGFDPLNTGSQIRRNKAVRNIRRGRNPRKPP